MTNGSTTRTNESSRTTAGSEPASNPIEAHRTGNLSVTVTSDGGNPVPDASVSVTMREHDFAFGTSVGSRYLVEDAPPDGPYRSHLRELFNTAVVEHRNKWRPWENDSERTYALAATDWLRTQGFRLRGHTVLWQTLGQPVVPEDVIAKLESDDDDRAEYVAERSDEHVTDIVGHYDDDVVAWDVVNEPLHAHALTDVLDPDAPTTRHPHLRRWFELAREAADAPTLYLNEYEILTDGDEAVRDDYEQLARHLLDDDAVDLGGLGMQSHFDHPDATRSPDAIRETLDRYAALDVDLTITEYDTTGDAWTERAAADHLASFLPTVFAHPAVDGFVMWGFWDGLHYENQAPLFREDWTPKPALDVYQSLVFDEWWTDEGGWTDADGRYRTSVFLGKHEITVSNGDTTRSTVTTVTDSTGTTAVDFTFSDE